MRYHSNFLERYPRVSISGAIAMEKTENSDLPSITFNKPTQDKSLSQDYKKGNVSLNSKTDIAISDEDVDQELNARIQHVVKISQSSVGLLFACIQISKDWNKLSESGFYLGDRYIHLSRLIKKLQQVSDFETDRQQAKSIKNPVLKLLSRIPSQNFNANQKDWVLAIRGLVMIHALMANKKPSSQLIDGLTKLFAKKPEYENIADFNLTANKEYIPNNNQQDHEVFLFTLQKLFTKPLFDLEHLVSPKSTHLIQTGSNSKDGQPINQELLEVTNSIQEGDEQKYKADLINYIIYVQQFMGEKQRVGIIERYDYVQTFEIELIIPRIVEDLKDPNVSKLALATLLTFFLHCRPKRFGMIGLKPTSDVTAWINLVKGCFCWELNAVTEKIVKDEKNKTIISIPFPDQIIDILRELLQQKPTASANLGDLFNINLKELDIECKRYLKDKSLTSHWLSLSRLETSFSRYVLSEVNDEVYASALGLDFCLGTTSNFNYFVIRGDRLSKVLQGIYPKLGFSEQLISPLHDVGSSTGLAYYTVWNLVKSLSNKAYQTSSSVAKNTSYQNLIRAHNDLATSIGTLTSIFTGHRAAEAYGFSRHTLDLDRNLCLICDKRVSDYQWARVVPIPSVIAIWIDFYISWLKSIKYRLSSTNKELTFQIEAALNSTSDQSHPLFFTISNNKIKPFSSSDFSLAVENFSLPTNCGRHFVDYLLRDAELDSAQIMAFEGHANKGQEAFGPTSLMSLIQVAEKIRYVLDQAIDAKKLTYPPKLNPRRLDCSSLRFPRIQFTSLLTDKYEIKDKHSAQCPFDERSLELMNDLIKHGRDWCSACGKITLSDLVYSLTLIDGVASQDELLEAISQILDGEIYALGDRFFIDTASKKLGIRRIWISFSTVLIVSSLAEAGGINQIKLDLNKAQFKFFCNSLVESVATHYSVYAPGMLAAWARGEVCSRTTRIETLARHHFNCPEKTNFGFTKLKRREVLLDDYLIRKAINRACDSSQNIGTNETRLKHLLVEINELLDFQIDEISTLLLAKFTVYLISIQIAVSTVSRYYSAVRQFLDYFLDDLSEFSQLTQINWTEIVKSWQQSRRLDAESGPESAAINHFLTFVDSDVKIKGSLHDLSSAVMEHADFASQDEISKSFEYIDSNLELDEATKLKAKVILGLLSQYALRPSEVRNIRVCDVYTEDPAHFVITSEAIGKVKTRNANRVLLLKDDQFYTRENLLRLCDYKTGLPDKAFLFGDDVDGSTLDGSQLLFNIVHDALQHIAGFNISIMSFRHFNVSRAVGCAIDNAGMDALKDRKILSVIAANSGHGNARTTLQNYCCDLDRRRDKFWEQHRSNLKFGNPIPQIKERVGLDFKGNLPFNQSSLLLLMQIIRDQFPQAHARIKNCQDFVLKWNQILGSSAETNYKQLAAYCRYCFYTLAGVDSEAAVFKSNILQREKHIFDEGYIYLKDTLNMDWCNSQLSWFRSTIQSLEFSNIVSKISVMPIDHRDAIQIAQAINNINGKWVIKNLRLLDLLERNLPIFLAANLSVEISVNQSLQVNIRKSLRQKPFIQFSEKALARDVFCQISFWNTDMKRSMRARHYQEIMIQINLIFLTKAIIVLGQLHG